MPTQNPSSPLLQRLSDNTRSAVLVILAFCLPLFYLGLNLWGWFDPDEGRYAEVPREMLASGDFITPRLNSVNYFEKPPLLYWMSAGLFKTFGLHEWVGRLGPATAALVGVLLAYGVGRRILGRRGGLVSALVLATCLIWAVLSRELLIDMLLATAMFAASAFWWLGYSDNGPRQRGYYLCFWISLAYAVLLKGPVAVVLVGAAIGAYLLWFADWSALKKMEWAFGVPVFLLITAPWFILVAQHNPTFNNFFWYQQHVQRFLGSGGHAEHVKPFYYFIEFLPVVLFPWSALLPGAIPAFRRKAPGLKGEASYRMHGLVYMFCSAGLITLFFSISKGKLLTYILPAIPAYAVLLAGYIETLFDGPRDASDRCIRVGGTLLAVVLGATIVVGLAIGPKKMESMEALSFSVCIPLLIVAAAWLAAIVFQIARPNLEAFVVTLSVGLLAFFMGALPVIAAIAPHHYIKPLLDYIQPGLARPDSNLVCYGAYSQSIGFYTGRRVVFIREPGAEDDGGAKADEIDPGRRDLSPAEQKIWFPVGLDKLAAAMNVATPVYAVVSDHDAARKLVGEIGNGAAEIDFNKRRAIIGNAAAARLTPPVVGGQLGNGTD